jgi:Zn-dependent protease
MGAMAAELIAVDQAACATGLLERVPADLSLLRIRRLLIPLLALRMFRYSLPGQGMQTRLADLAVPADFTPAGQSPAVLRAGFHELVEQDIERYQQLAVKKGGLGKLAKLALLVVTIGLFALFWGGEDVGESVGIIIGVLLLHEFGHWLPMKLFGYQNVTMFFIPGFGAAVTGEKHAVPAWQEFIVLLGGPLPGLVAGISVMILGYFYPEIPDLLLDAAVISVLLNAFNLLPFLPLDGGRILDLLIFKDLPLLRLLFNGFSTLLAVGVCLIPGNRGFIFLAVVMVMGCISQLKLLPMIRMAKKLGWAGKITTEEGALRQFFTELRASGNTTYVGSPNWLAKTKIIIEEALRKPPSWFARISGLGIYAATGLLPLLLFAALGWYVVERIDKKPVRSTCLMDLQQQLPANTVALGATDRAPLLKLATEMEALWSDKDVSDVHAVATSLPSATMRELDKLRWDHIGIAEREGALSSSTVAIWLEAACQSMENASNSGKNIEAVRRLEIMLYAIHSLEPAMAYSQREQLWEVQEKTLKTLGKLNGTGAISPELQGQLKQRLQLLRQVPNPAREAFLLVEGWSRLETLSRFSRTLETPTATSEEEDENLCRGLYRLLQKPEEELSRGVIVEKIALRWVQQGKVDGLPDESPSEEPVKDNEVHFLRSDRDRRQEIIWLQETVLHVMNLDATQKQKGRLPEKWDHPLAGGGKLELISAPKPTIRLTDARSEAQHSGPAWLGKSPAVPRAAIDFPLRPVP